MTDTTGLKKSIYDLLIKFEKENLPTRISLTAAIVFDLMLKVSELPVEEKTDTKTLEGLPSVDFILASKLPRLRALLSLGSAVRDILYVDREASPLKIDDAIYSKEKLIDKILVVLEGRLKLATILATSESIEELKKGLDELGFEYSSQGGSIRYIFQSKGAEHGRG